MSLDRADEGPKVTLPETVSRRTVLGRFMAGAVAAPVRAAYTSPRVLTLGLVSPTMLTGSGPVRPPSGGGHTPKPPSAPPPADAGGQAISELPSTGVGIH